MKIAAISKVTLFPQSESLEKDRPKTSLVPLQHLPQKLVWLIIVLGLLFRLLLLSTPLTYGTDAWRQADTASIAHNFVGSYNLFYPQINWGGNGPGYVETEFQLYPFIVALLYTLFVEHWSLGRLVSLFFTGPTFILFYLLAQRVLGPRVALWSLAFFFEP